VNLVPLNRLCGMCEINEYLKNYPELIIVNLGCDLDETGKANGNGC